MSEESTAAVPSDAAAYREEYLGVPGVRFAPTDQELIVHYLGRKLRNEPLPTNLVVDSLDAYWEHPNKLVPKLGEGIGGAWYIFSPRDRKYAGGMRPKRDPGDGEGRWKAVEAEKLVLGGADGKEVIGAKRALTFHEQSDQQVDALGKRKRGSIMSKPTKWKMVEFVFSNSSRSARDDDTALDPMLLNECVLCKITNKSLRAANRDPAQGEEKEENDDDNGEEEPAPDGGAGGESQEKRLPEQQPATASGGGAGSHGNRQPSVAEAPRWGNTAALPHDDYRGAKYFVGVDANRSGTNSLSVFGSDDHIGAFYGGGGGSHGNRQAVTSEAPSGRQMAAPPGDDYRGAKYFVGVDGSNWFGTNRLSVSGSDDHIGAFYGGGAGSYGNRQPATAEAPSGQQMAVLPGDEYRGAKYFVNVDGSNWSGTNWSASVLGSDDHIGAFYGSGDSLGTQRAGNRQEASAGGAGSSPDEQQQPTPEAPNGGGAAATGAASQQSAPYYRDWTGNFVIMP